MVRVKGKVWDERCLKELGKDKHFVLYTVNTLGRGLMLLHFNPFSLGIKPSIFCPTIGSLSDVKIMNSGYVTDSGS